MKQENWMVFVQLLKTTSEEKGISLVEIAEKTGLKANNISRVFSLQYCPTLRTYLLIASAIGVNFFFEDKDAKTDLSQMFEKAMTELGRRTDSLPKN